MKKTLATVILFFLLSTTFLDGQIPLNKGEAYAYVAITYTEEIRSNPNYVNTLHHRDLIDEVKLLPVSIKPVVSIGQNIKSSRFTFEENGKQKGPLQLVVDGTIQFYEFFESGQARYFVQKRDHEFQELRQVDVINNGVITNTNQFRAVLINLMNDEEVLWNDILELSLEKEDLSRIINAYNNQGQYKDVSLENHKLKKAFAQSGMYVFSKDIPADSQLDFNYGLNREFVLTKSNSSKNFSAHFGIRYSRIGYNSVVKMSEMTQKLSAALQDDFQSVNDVEGKVVSATRETFIGIPIYIRLHARDKFIGFIGEIGSIVGSNKMNQTYDQELSESSWEIATDLIVSAGIAVNVSKKIFIATMYDVTNGMLIKAETRF